MSMNHLLCFFLEYFVFLHDRLDLVPDGGHQGGEDLTNISDDREGEGDANDGEENAK